MIFEHAKTGARYVEISESDANLNGMDYTVVSLFTGAGGLDIGLEQAGFRTIVCVENDPHCRATLRHNRPEWRLFEESVKNQDGHWTEREPGDIRAVEVGELLSFGNLQAGKVGLVVGGAPCQPFSNIGKKQGENDERNGDLFLEFVRMVKGIQPEAFIFENVAGITQTRHSNVLQYMFEQFKDSGYQLSYSLLNAANYGVPQRRERFILIGIKGLDKPAFPLPTHTKDRASWLNFIKDLNTPPSTVPQKWRTVQDAFSSLPKDYKERTDYAVMNISPIVQERMKLIRQGQNFKVLPMEMRPNCWKTGKHQGNDTFGRLIAEFPSVTIRTAAYNPAKGMYIHPHENRGLNTVEMAALQDFPIEWVFKTQGQSGITLVSGGKQIGNAVPPGLARALGLALRKQISANIELRKKQILPAELNPLQTRRQQQLAVG